MGLILLVWPQQSYPGAVFPVGFFGLVVQELA
jgi:hypothetical protein